MKQTTTICENVFEFILGSPLLLVMGPAHKCLIYSVRIHWRQLIFPLAIRCQLYIASWVGMGAHAYLPLSVLGPHLS